METAHVQIIHSQCPEMLRDQMNIEVHDLTDKGFTIVAIECEGDKCEIWYE